MIQKDFLQSAQWRKFQESVGRRTHTIEDADFACQASIIEHVLPFVGKYFYCPRGPMLKTENTETKIKSFLNDLIELAKKENANWIRIEPKNEEILEKIRKNLSEKIVKAPHDVQPKEVFVLDISKDQDQLLVEMKSKTRYNIKLAQKKGVLINNSASDIENKEKYTQDFLRLTLEMASRQGITPHPAQYYRKMLETFPDEMLQIYVAKHDGKVISTNMILFFEGTATYLHGASSDEDRNVMAPFLLHWQAILDAKKRGCVKYDFGGIKSKEKKANNRENDWAGITNFKMGFSPETEPIIFPGTYDVILNSRAYALYRGLQKAKSFAHKFKR